MQTAQLAEYCTSVTKPPEFAALGAELDEIGTDMSKVTIRNRARFLIQCCPRIGPAQTISSTTWHCAVMT